MISGRFRKHRPYREGDESVCRGEEKLGRRPVPQENVVTTAVHQSEERGVVGIPQVDTRRVGGLPCSRGITHPEHGVGVHVRNPRHDGVEVVVGSNDRSRASQIAALRERCHAGGVAGVRSPARDGQRIGMDGGVGDRAGWSVVGRSADRRTIRRRDRVQPVTRVRRLPEGGKAKECNCQNFLHRYLLREPEVIPALPSGKGRLRAKFHPAEGPKPVPIATARMLLPPSL